MLLSFTMCPTGDPQYFTDITLKTGASGNYGGYSNAEANALIEQLDVESDPAKRTELAKQIQKSALFRETYRMHHDEKISRQQSDAMAAELMEKVLLKDTDRIVTYSHRLCGA